MRLFGCAFILIVSLRFTVEVTPNIYVRIEHLQNKLKAELSKGKMLSGRDGKLAPLLIDSESSDQAYGYVETVAGDGHSATPILDRDVMKKHTLHNVKAKASTKKTQRESAIESAPSRSVPVLRERRRRKPVTEDMFYRRSDNSEYLKLDFFRGKQLPWVHCHDVITPILTGSKSNVTTLQRRVGEKDHSFLRFMVLLNVNTTEYSADEVFSVLYQISRLQLRLFLWDQYAMKRLLNFVIQGPEHSFTKLKVGLKELFARWRLDYAHNTTNLLKQSRMFRPPCVIATLEGSTRYSKGHTLTPPQPRTKKICDGILRGECID